MLDRSQCVDGRDDPDTLNIVFSPLPPPQMNTSTYAYTESSLSLACFSCGYFAWDLYTTFSENMDKEWKVHAVASILTYISVGSLSTTPINNWFGVYYLLNEASTPFFSLRTIMINYQLTEKCPRLFRFVQGSFVTTFIAVRIVLSAQPTYAMVTRNLAAIPSARTPWDVLVRLYVCGISLPMYALNLTWAMQIYRALTRGKRTKNA